MCGGGGGGGGGGGDGTLAFIVMLFGRSTGVAGMFMLPTSINRFAC